MSCIKKRPGFNVIQWDLPTSVSLRGMESITLESRLKAVFPKRGGKANGQAEPKAKAAPKGKAAAKEEVAPPALRKTGKQSAA